jgi:hypothetical protein
MSLSYHHQRLLHRIGTGLVRSDPQLAAMLSVFARLSADEAMPAWEQVSSKRQSIRLAAALTVRVAILVAQTIALLLRAVLALLIVVGTRNGPRPPAPRSERTRRTRRGRGADGRTDPADQAYGL